MTPVYSRGRILYLVMGKVGRQERGIPVQNILQQLRGEGERVAYKSSGSRMEGTHLLPLLQCRDLLFQYAPWKTVKCNKQQLHQLTAALGREVRAS